MIKTGMENINTKLRQMQMPRHGQRASEMGWKKRKLISSTTFVRVGADLGINDKT